MNQVQAHMQNNKVNQVQDHIQNSKMNQVQDHIQNNKMNQVQTHMQNNKVDQAQTLMQNNNIAQGHSHTPMYKKKMDQTRTLMQNSKVGQTHTLMQSGKMDQIQSPKKRGRVSESLDEFLQCIIKNCSKTLDPSPRKRGRPAEPLEICDPFLCYTEVKPFSKRGRPPVNLIWPGCIPNLTAEKGIERAEIVEVSPEIFNPEMLNEKEEVKVVMVKHKKKKESGKKTAC